MDFGALAGATKDSLPWFVSGTLFTTLCGGVAAVWRAINSDKWMRTKVHDEIVNELRADRDWWRSLSVGDQELIGRLSQTNSVAVGRIAQKATAESPPKESMP